jgi:phenylalanine-4-hydroxylase
MMAETGWTIRPVAGLISSRDFFEGLANKVFCSTQFIRSDENIEFSPLPDMIHEVIGHTSSLATEQFSTLAEEFGKISLKLNDKEIDRLAKLFWYTNEVGMIKNSEGIKVYGAAIVSSPKESIHC